MVVVKKKKGDHKDSIFKKFTRLFIDEEIVDEVRKRQYYKRPSQVEKERKIEQRKNRRRR